jgi:hypothetical protein
MLQAQLQAVLQAQLGLKGGLKGPLVLRWSFNGRRKRRRIGIGIVMRIVRRRRRGVGKRRPY